MTYKYDAVVVGAGAAGMMYAALLARSGAAVAVVEKNTAPGKKILVTGKGRCNVTNNCTAEEFLENVRSGAKFLNSAARGFDPYDVMEFFQTAGVPLKTERGGRVFPVSDRAGDISDALYRECTTAGVKFFFSSPVRGLVFKKDGISGIMTEDGREFSADAVAVATGGLSYPGTGSTGDGYRFAKAAGHSVVPTKASLVPVAAREGFCSELMGLSLKNVTLTLLENGKPVFEELGEMLFTHFGISGPLVLSASAHIKKSPELYGFSLDLKPGLDPEKLDARILRDFEENKNKNFANALDKLLPQKLIPVVIELSGIHPDRKVNSITKSERRALVELLKNFRITPKSLRPVKEAIVTAGGVATDELEPRSMRSKKIPGLYFVGEVIDADAYTGGYNLQIAFCTAAAAAKDTAKNLRARD